MRPTLLSVLPAFSLLPIFYCHAGNFNGPIMGVGAGYGYSRGDFNNTVFRGTSLTGKVFGGYGWVQNDLHWGIEIDAGYDNFSKTVKKFPPQKLSKGHFFEGSFRIGQVIRTNFLPFLRFGMGYEQYRFISRDLEKKSFYAKTLLIGLGTDAIIHKDWSIRSEISHNWAFKVNSNTIPVGRKPFKTALTLSIIYHL